MKSKAYAISAGHPATLEAAEEIFSIGGNAFDAAIAAYAASWVAEPCMSGMGGGGFALVREANGRMKMLDFFCQTPKTKLEKRAQDFHPIAVDFGDEQEIFYVGKGSIAIPGAIAGAYRIHREYATLPMEVLLKPAIRFAREGVGITPFQYYDFQLLSDIIRLSPRGLELFFDNGQVKKTGEILAFPAMGDLLEQLALDGPDLFYRGEVAARITRDCVEGGGHLRQEDLSDYRVLVSDPLNFTFQRRRVSTNNFPSMGGALLCIFLRYIDELMLRKEFQSAELEETVLLSAVYCDALDKSFDNIKRVLAQKTGKSFPESYHMGPHGRGGTTHMNFADAEGNAVSLSSSLGEGSGYFIPDTDIQLNNMLGEEALMPGGLNSWEPNVRMGSMMSPTCLEDPETGQFLMLGSGGAGRIPFVLAQVLVKYILNGTSLEDSVEAPRIHCSSGVLNTEPGAKIQEDKLPDAYQLKQWMRKSLYFGGVHALCFDSGRLAAVADQRRDGVAKTGGESQ